MVKKEGVSFQEAAKKLMEQFNNEKIHKTAGSYSAPKKVASEMKTSISQPMYHSMKGVFGSDNRSQSVEKDPVVYCSTCGAPHNPPFDNHQPTIDSIEDEFADSDLVINMSLQDDNSLFVALLEEASPRANQLEHNIRSHRLVSDVSMVDGGLVVETFMKSVDCDNCDESSVIEWTKPDEYVDRKSQAQEIQNKLMLLKQMADDDVVNRFEGLLDGDAIDKDAVKHREYLKSSREKFHQSQSEEQDTLGYESLYPNVSENLELGQNLELDSLSTQSVDVDTSELNGVSLSVDGERVEELDDLEKVKEELEERGFVYYSPEDNDDS